MGKPIRCPICSELQKDKGLLFSHIEDEHIEVLPKGWSGARFYFQQIHGRTTSHCITCGAETGWNDITNKPYRFCKKPKCTEIYIKTFRKRMTQKYGKTHLLDDPKIQQKMLRGRSISGEYIFKDGGKVPYVGSYEKDFLQFLDVFLGFKSRDIIECPYYFEYEYEGEKKLYIPDFFIPSTNTIIEIKDGKLNPNTMPKIQEVDKVKEKAKDEVMSRQKDFNYIKITDKIYKPFLDFLIQLKENYDYTTMKFKRPLTLIGEHTNLLLESINYIINFPEDEIDQLNERLSDDLPIYTTRVSAEYGKYRKNHIYSSNLKYDLKVISIVNIDGYRNHPFIKELTDNQIDELKKYKKMQLIKLEKVKSSNLSEEYSVNFTGERIRWKSWGNVEYEGIIVEDDMSDTLHVKLDNGEIKTCDRSTMTEYLNESSKDCIPLTFDEEKEVKERFGEISCWICKNASGRYFCRTNRVKSKLYDSIQDIPKEIVKSIAKK